MTVTGWSLVRFVHVLSAMGWVGGQLLLSLVVLPVIRTDLDDAIRAPLVRRTAKRFGLISNAALLPLLLLSGIALAAHRGVEIAHLGDPGYTRLLSIKLVLVILSISLAATHGLLATSRPRLARPLAITGLATSVGIVVFATALVP